MSQKFEHVLCIIFSIMAPDKKENPAFSQSLQVSWRSCTSSDIVSLNSQLHIADAIVFFSAKNMLIMFIEASTWASNYATHNVCATADITFLTMKLGSQGAEVALDSSNDLSVAGYPWLMSYLLLEKTRDTCGAITSKR